MAARSGGGRSQDGSFLIVLAQPSALRCCCLLPRARHSRRTHFHGCFEVTDKEAVAAAGDELQHAGFELLHPARTEPWGQTVTRLLTTDGLIVGISYAPAFHDDEPA